MKQILSMLVKHNRQIAIALVLAFCAALTDQLVPRFLRDLMNGIAITGKDEATTFLLLAMAGAYIGAQLLRVLQRVAVERAATRLGAELMSRGMSHLVGNSMAWHLDAPVGQIHVRLERSAHAIADLLKVVIGDIVGPLMGIVFALILLFETNSLSGVTALGVALALCAVTALQISNQNGVRVAINRAREALGADIVDAITNVETVKLCGAEAAEAERVEGTSSALADREFRHHKAMAVFDMAKAVIDHGGFVLVVAAGVWGHWDASASGAMVLVVLCYQRLMEPLRSMHRIVDEVAERMALARDYLSLQEAPQIALPDEQSMNPECAISVRDVMYSYPHASKPALSGVSIDIPHGARVALVGSSGEGKSTLAKLLSGVLVPSDGVVTIAGARVQPIELQNSTQRAVAVLTQEVRLFSGSVIENIRYGTPTSSDEAVLRAAEAAGIRDLLFEPDGAHRKIRARGEGVSGGQRQRIGIARVLLRGAPVVVLDEPTSAQDAARRVTFFDLVLRAFVNQTVVVITHDTASLDWATHVLRLREGKVVNESIIAAPIAMSSSITPVPAPFMHAKDARRRLLGCDERDLVRILGPTVSRPA
ncbi:MAG: ABC transporter ATP-binding protein [Pseudomonadota bacterium]